MLRLNGQFNINPDVVRGDKSVCHRALIFAAIATETSVIRNLTASEDVLATVDCLRKLGAQIDLNGDTATVKPIVTPCNSVTLDCKNSGTTARLLAGLVAGLGVKARFVGDGSLTSRPMNRVLTPLTKLGASFKQTEGLLFESLGGVIHGGTIYAEVNSAQVKSAVLIAGLFANGSVTYVEKLPTRNHTEIMLRQMGADITVDGLSSTVTKSRLQPVDLVVPNDVSSMAFLVGAALLTNRETVCKNTLLNARRIGFLQVLKASGANVDCVNVREVLGEKVGDIVVKRGRLKPLFASAADVCDSIDELPMLATIALAIKGKHVFEDVAELQHKESDRVKAILDTAGICNQIASFDGRNLTIESDGQLPKNPRFNSYNDHRVAMAQAALCLAVGGGSVNTVPFSVSFPEFLTALGVSPLKLGLIGSDIAKSRSPQLMEYLATQAGVACSYDLIQLPADVDNNTLLNVINAYDGLNVTMPFKGRIAGLLGADVVSVNTLGKHVKPQSTDGYGLIKALTDANVDFANKPLWVVGAGGAAALCIETLLQYGCKIKVINRTQSRADALTDKYGLSADISEPYGILSFIPECEFEQSLTLPQSCKFVFVAAYKGQSGLKNQALARGLIYVDGLSMLYHQGAKSFSLWTGTPLQDDCKGFEQYLKKNKDVI